MSAPPIGSTTMLPSSAGRDQDPEDEQRLRVRAGGEHDRASRRAITNSASVDERLARELDRPAREDLLELAERDVRAPERDRADDRGEQRRDLDLAAAKPPPKWWRYSTHAISATAPPPTPLNSATICGIAVISHVARRRDPDRGPDHEAEQRSATACSSRSARAASAASRRPRSPSRRRRSCCRAPPSAARSARSCRR